MQSNEDSQSRRKQIAENLRSSFNNSDNVRIIPSRQDLGQDTIDRPERIGAYCRVSTKADAQVESYEMQKKYYEDYILKHPSWTLVDIYADEGISATSMKNRKDFLRLVQDCKSGRITKVITKSISRFARNVVDCVDTARMLKNLTPPVGIIFETDNLDTLRNDMDSQLSIRASFAEYESVTKSNAVKWGIKSRFANGIPALRDLYGYSRNKRILTIDPTESQIIQMMYQQVADGHSIAEVQRILRSTRVPSPSGNADWSNSTILYILTNEKYCGDVRMQKQSQLICSLIKVLEMMVMSVVIILKTTIQRSFNEIFGIRFSGFLAHANLTPTLANLKMNSNVCQVGSSRPCLRKQEVIHAGSTRFQRFPNSSPN